VLVEEQHPRGAVAAGDGQQRHCARESVVKTLTEELHYCEKLEGNILR